MNSIVFTFYKTSAKYHLSYRSVHTCIVFAFNRKMLSRKIRQCHVMRVSMVLRYDRNCWMDSQSMKRKRGVMDRQTFAKVFYLFNEHRCKSYAFTVHCDDRNHIIGLTIRGGILEWTSSKEGLAMPASKGIMNYVECNLRVLLNRLFG